MRCRNHRLGILGGLGAAVLGLSGCVGLPSLTDPGFQPEAIAQEVPQAHKRTIHLVFVGGIDPIAGHEFKTLFNASRQAGYTRSYHCDFWTGLDRFWLPQELLKQLENRGGEAQSVVVVSQDHAWKSARDLVDLLAQSGHTPELLIEIDPPLAARRLGSDGLGVELVQIVADSCLRGGETVHDNTLVVAGSTTWTLPMHPQTRELIQDRLAQIAMNTPVVTHLFRHPLLDPGPDTPRVVPPGAPPLVPLPGPGWVPGSGPWPGTGNGQPPPGKVPVLVPPRGLPANDPWEFLMPRPDTTPSLPIMPRKVAPPPLLPGEIRPGLGT